MPEAGLQKVSLCNPRSLTVDTAEPFFDMSVLLWSARIEVNNKRLEFCFRKKCAVVSGKVSLEKNRHDMICAGRFSRRLLFDNLLEEACNKPAADFLGLTHPCRVFCAAQNFSLVRIFFTAVLLDAYEDRPNLVGPAGLHLANSLRT